MVLTWVFCLIYMPSAWGAEKYAEVNSEVKPHRWSAIRLSNVNRGATLEVKLTLDGQATVVLVSESQLKNYPRVARPLFRTETRNRAVFSFVAPRDDNYYLIVDNRKGAAKRKYSLTIKARLDLPGEPSQDRQRLTSKDPLELLNRVIQTAFVVDPIKFKMTTCDSADTITRGATIYLCQEYLKRLKGQFSDNRKVNEIVLFALMREAGHVLLIRWQYPLINNRYVKDEFAATLLLMFGRREAVEVQAKYSALLEPERKQRSDTLRQWLDDPFFVKKWQPLLVPKMQTSYLQLLKEEGPTWASRKLIDRELTRRE